MKDILLRPEIKSDERIVDEITRDAFWNVHVPGCCEHYLLHILRKSDCFINELDYVAEIDGKIVGNIVYSKAEIICDNDEVIDVITFGPVSVLPEFQRKGIGKALIEHTVELAKNMGYRAILIYGDPDYYARFGFVKAEEFCIGTSDNMYAESLQALELIENGLEGICGRFFENSIFDVDEKLAIEFDAEFPEKNKISNLNSQKRFLYLVNSRKKRVNK